ncbi:COMM domain-containing protein 2 [Chionoecetes opilio]|uniref:COMM domain-containing protein 2 n=1 Tax=Chionoecetes opilio TaxID=41210 RepID=A0A8J4XLU2_CHIOP|nr:COMM domain-containing protein 2 [Chionoecetes opilio]
MAPVTLPEELRAKLSFLVTQDTPVVREFCRLATQYFRQEVKPRVFTSAATKLGAQPSQVEDAVQALVFLLIRCSQGNTTTTELHTLATSLGLNDDAAKVLVATYTDSEAEVKDYVKTLGVKTPQYKNLEWRFDILVGSRSLHHLAEPLLTLQLSLDTGSPSKEGREDEACESLVLQTDPNNLLHITSVLEEALHEARTHHSRRVQRYLK